MGCSSRVHHTNRQKAPIIVLIVGQKILVKIFWPKNRENWGVVHLSGYFLHPKTPRKPLRNRTKTGFQVTQTGHTDTQKAPIIVLMYGGQFWS